MIIKSAHRCAALPAQSPERSRPTAPRRTLRPRSEYARPYE